MKEELRLKQKILEKKLILRYDKYSKKEKEATKMKVILLENIKGVGKKDEVIEASDGYARNFLFPKKLAIEANAENMSKLKGKNDSNAYKKSVEKAEAQKIADKLKDIILKIAVKSGENGKIFGSITSKEIADSLKEQHEIDVDKKKVELKEPIKTLGNFSVSIKLYEGVNATLKIQIIE